MAKKTSKKPIKKAVKKATKKVAPAKKKVVKKAAKKATKKVDPAKKKVVKKAASKASAAKKPVTKKVVKKAAKKASRPGVTKAEVKSTSISPYLIFRGNCEEAFDLYRAAFGGNFAVVSRFNEMPPMEGQPPMPESEGNKLMHISLPISKETVLMGSDSSEAFGHATVIGNNFSVSINAKSQSEADRLFNVLSVGGTVTMPMEKTFWGSYFGMLTDKFGIQWQVSFGQ